MVGPDRAPSRVTDTTAGSRIEPGAIEHAEIVAVGPDTVTVSFVSAPDQVVTTPPR